MLNIQIIQHAEYSTGSRQLPQETTMKPPYRIRYSHDCQRYEIWSAQQRVRVFRRGVTSRHVESVHEEMCVAWFLNEAKYRERMLQHG
jgi:uncharacterized protein YqiB (DUF1249 family)